MEQNPVTSYPPTIGDSYGNGWKQLWKFFLELLLIGIIVFMLGLPIALPSWILNFDMNSESFDGFDALESFGPSFFMYILLVIAYSVLFLNPLNYGVKYAYLKAARNEKVEVRDMFSFTANYLHAVLANILVGFIIGIGILMLIIPGIVFACKLAFVPYLIIDKKMETIEALKESWRMTDGHAIDIFVMGLLAIPIAIIGLLMLFVGIIPAAMWISMGFASIYHAVDKMQQQTPKVPAV